MAKVRLIPSGGAAQACLGRGGALIRIVRTHWAEHWGGDGAPGLWGGYLETPRGGETPAVLGEIGWGVGRGGEGGG